MPPDPEGFSAYSWTDGLPELAHVPDDSVSCSRGAPQQCAHCRMVVETRLAICQVPTNAQEFHFVHESQRLFFEAFDAFLAVCRCALMYWRSSLVY